MDIRAGVTDRLEFLLSFQLSPIQPTKEISTKFCPARALVDDLKVETPPDLGQDRIGSAFKIR